MRLIFVRHGHPNYELDCLTELGHQQAEAAAVRLLDEGISEIYSSTCGRAYETAQHAAAQLKLPIVKCDFMREIRWAPKDGTEMFQNGNPWFLAWDMIARGQSLRCSDWQEREPHCHSIVTEYYEAVSRDIDEWLLALGYRREGEYYRVVGENTDRTVAMFSHGGSSACALSHIANIPFPQFCATYPFDFTAITTFGLSNQTGVLTAPRFEVIGDARHIRGFEKKE